MTTEQLDMNTVSGMVKAVLRRMDQENDNEVYYGLIGQIHNDWWWAQCLGDHAEGSPGQVEFNWRLIMDREESHGDIVGFYHTHPQTVGCPSHRDYRTMGAWTVSFGRPLLCLIEGVDGLNANWFKDDETNHIRGSIVQIGDIYVGKVPQWS